MIQKLGLLFHLCYFCDILLLKYILCKYLEVVTHHVKLGNRAEFFIPADVKKRLKDGNRQLYDNQYLRYRAMLVSDERLRPLVAMIHKYGKAYEQEGYIKY